MRSLSWTVLALLLFAAACPPAGAARTRRAARSGRAFTATAFSTWGTTASGSTTRRGVVAADPSVLPLGSRIRVSGAGAYSGLYTVTDTGQKISGQMIDIYIPDTAAAKRFGKKPVRVTVLSKAAK